MTSDSRGWVKGGPSKVVADLDTIVDCSASTLLLVSARLLDPQFRLKSQTAVGVSRASIPTSKNDYHAPGNVVMHDLA